MSNSTLMIPENAGAPSGPRQLPTVLFFFFNLLVVLLFWRLDPDLRGHWTTGFDEHCEQRPFHRRG